MTTTEPCVQPWARANGTLVGTCDCNGGFSGPTCRDVLRWWQGVNTLEFALMLAFTACMFGWCVFALLFDVCLSDSTRSRRWNLKKVARCLIVAGLLVRTCMRAIPRSAMQLEYDKPEPLALKVVIPLFGSLSHAFLSAAFSLVLGFWIDALHAKMHVVVAKRTKIACVVVALVMLLAIPGSIMSSMLDMATIGVVLIVVPYLVNTVFFVTMISILCCSCCLQNSRQRVLAESTKAKIRYARRWAIITTIGWVGAVVCETVSGLVRSLPYMDTSGYIPHIIGIMFEAVMILGTVMLLEHRVAMSKVCYSVIHWETAEAAVTTTQPVTDTGNITQSDTMSRSKNSGITVKTSGSVGTRSHTGSIEVPDSTTSNTEDSS